VLATRGVQEIDDCRLFAGVLRAKCWRWSRWVRRNLPPIVWMNFSERDFIRGERSGRAASHVMTQFGIEYAD